MKTKQTALQKTTDLRIQALDLLTQVRKEIDKTYGQQLSSPGDHRLAGDMEHAVEQLQEILKGFGA